MKKAMFLVIAGVLAGCGSDDDGGSSAPTLDSPSAINTYLDGKTLVMEGDNIPTEPNGYNENLNLGPYSQCYNKTTITIAGGTWNVNSDLGTITNNTCDRNTVSGPASFSSTTVLIENVQDNGSCFDLTVNYGSFQQEGRAAFNADGTQLSMELYFQGQATGNRCADGAVGDQTVTLNGQPFTGNAVQVYVIQ